MSKKGSALIFEGEDYPSFMMIQSANVLEAISKQNPEVLNYNFKYLGLYPRFRPAGNNWKQISDEFILKYGAQIHSVISTQGKKDNFLRVLLSICLGKPDQ